MNIKKYYIRTNKEYIAFMTVISSVHIIAYFYMGFALGFSKSPYSHKMLMILNNFIVQIVPILGIELVRGILISRYRNNKKFILFTILILALVEINYGEFIDLFSNKEELFRYVCSVLLPIIAHSILYTYLSLKGTFILPIIYRLFTEGIILLLPILPNTNWFVTGSFSIISTIIVYLLFKYKLEDVTKTRKILSERLSYGIALTISILLICFMLGAFEYEPMAILSNSMEPIFSRGDIVIYKKMSQSQLKQIPINSIIIYSMEEKNIAHRVVDIVKENNTVLYKTKGDSNNAQDKNLVSIEQIKGIYVFSIKYIGFPSVWLYAYFNSEK